MNGSPTPAEAAERRGQPSPARAVLASAATSRDSQTGWEPRRKLPFLSTCGDACVECDAFVCHRLSGPLFITRSFSTLANVQLNAAGGVRVVSLPDGRGEASFTGPAAQSTPGRKGPCVGPSLTLGWKGRVSVLLWSVVLSNV